MKVTFASFAVPYRWKPRSCSSPGASDSGFTARSISAGNSALSFDSGFGFSLSCATDPSITTRPDVVSMLPRRRRTMRWCERWQIWNEASKPSGVLFCPLRDQAEALQMRADIRGKVPAETAEAMRAVKERTESRRARSTCSSWIFASGYFERMRLRMEVLEVSLTVATRVCSG